MLQLTVRTDEASSNRDALRLLSVSEGKLHQLMQRIENVLQRIENILECAVTLKCMSFIVLSLTILSLILFLLVYETKIVPGISYEVSR